MKRVLAKISGLTKSQKFRKTAILIVVFCLGVISGVALMSVFAKEDKAQTSTTRSTTQSVEERAKRSEERLDEAYKRAQERIKSDVQSKRLEQDKADNINKKLDEIYKYRKSNQGEASEDKRKELQNKRKEWREWLEKNNASTRYFIGVL